MSTKKKYLAFLTSFETINGTTHVHKFLISKFLEKYDQIYFINIDHFLINKRNNYKFDEINLKDKAGILLFNPKNFSEFDKFLDDKEIIIISNFGRDFNSIKLHLYLKLKKLKIFQISNLGFFNIKPKLDIKNNFFKSIKYYFSVVFFKKFTVLLSNFGIVPKLEIRFISDKKIISNIHNNKIKKFLYKKKLLYAKKIILINSRSHDEIKFYEKFSSEEYIVHLDHPLNYPEELEFREAISNDDIKKHYFFLKNYLKNLSEKFNKKLIVCIHPGYNLKEYQKYFEEIPVIKFKTFDYISKAFVVTVFESSAVTQAILMKKRVIGLDSDYLDFNARQMSSEAAKNFGFEQFHIENDIDLNSKRILEIVEAKINNYDDYIKNYHHFNDDLPGYKQVINEFNKYLL